MHISPFHEVTVLLLIAMITGFVSQLLRQPIIVSYMLVGILVGPAFLGIVKSHEHIELFAELGVAILLFLVGLKLDIHLIKTLGPVSLATGIGQVTFTLFIGFLITLSMGMNAQTALYVAVALAFSSTIIVVKLLSDKSAVNTLYGQIAIGVLIIQDLVVVLAMTTLSVLVGPGKTEISTLYVVSIFFYGAIIVAFLGLFHGLANRLVNRIAHSSELLIIFAIGWATLFATLCSLFGFSKELGGLLAGMSLASTSIRDSIAARLSPLRDFLLLFFFIVLGSQLHLNELGHLIIPAVILSLFVLVGKPIIVLAIMGFMGYRKRTGLFVGLTLAQISEFSLVFMAMGLKLDLVSTDAIGLVTVIGLITIALSGYMIIYSQNLYNWIGPYLSLFERSFPYGEENKEELKSKVHDIIIFGLGRYGKEIVKELIKEKFNVLMIDYNPDQVRKWQNKGYNAIYGDACNLEFIRSLSIEKVKWVICAIPQHSYGLTHQDPRMVLIETLKYEKFSGKIAITTHHFSEIKLFKQMGVDLVLQPFSDAAIRTVERIIDS